jgi:hypothetical protein
VPTVEANVWVPELPPRRLLTLRRDYLLLALAVGDRFLHVSGVTGHPDRDRGFPDGE